MRTERMLLVVALISVGLNLLLGGVLLGRMAGPAAEASRLDPTIGVRRLITELPQERAEALAPHLRSYLSALRPRFREVRSAQRELRAAMLTEPLDQRALAESLAVFQARLTDSQRDARDAFVALAAAMTAEERRLLVAAMNAPPPHRPPMPPPSAPPP